MCTHRHAHVHLGAYPRPHLLRMNAHTHKMDIKMKERERERERGALRHSSFCVFYSRRRNRTGDMVVWSPWRLRRESLLRAIAQALGTAPSLDT